MEADHTIQSEVWIFDCKKYKTFSEATKFCKSQNSSLPFSKTIQDDEAIGNVCIRTWINLQRITNDEYIDGNGDFGKVPKI